MIMTDVARELIGHETTSILPDLVRGLPSHDQRSADCAVIAHAVLGKHHYAIAESDLRRYGYARDGNGTDFDQFIKLIKDRYATGRLTWYVDKARTLAAFISDKGSSFTGIAVVQNDHDEQSHVVPVADGIVFNASEDHWTYHVAAVLKINGKYAK